MTRPLVDPDSQPGLYRQLSSVRQRVSRLERRPVSASRRVVIAAKIVSDLMLVEGGEVFVFPADQDMDGLSLQSAHAYVTKFTPSPINPPIDKIEVQVGNYTPEEYMLTTPIVIDDGEWSSYTSGSPATVDPLYAQVALGDQILIEVTDPGAGDGYGLGVILEFA